MRNKWIIVLFVAYVVSLNAQNYAPNYQLINNQDYPTSDLAVAMYNVLDYGADPTKTIQIFSRHFLTRRLELV